ncbi:hypothetical protein HDU76_012576 [Blyttiomyces sp. JEL0837]|nr:hypothetical protein HDU76_012576 [Blyttiomyces sp. JEL0837]
MPTDVRLRVFELLRSSHGRLTMEREIPRYTHDEQPQVQGQPIIHDMHRGLQPAVPARRGSQQDGVRHLGVIPPPLGNIHYTTDDVGRLNQPEFNPAQYRTHTHENSKRPREPVMESPQDTHALDSVQRHREMIKRCNDRIKQLHQRQYVLERDYNNAKKFLEVEIKFNRRTRELLELGDIDVVILAPSDRQQGIALRERRARAREVVANYDRECAVIRDTKDSIERQRQRLTEIVTRFKGKGKAEVDDDETKSKKKKKGDP